SADGSTRFGRSWPGRAISASAVSIGSTWCGPGAASSRSRSRTSISGCAPWVCGPTSGSSRRARKEHVNSQLPTPNAQPPTPNGQRPTTARGSPWELGVGSWAFAVGTWKLGVGGWELMAGHTRYDYDVLVIGAGGAGLRAAIEAANAGVKVGLI